MTEVEKRYQSLAEKLLKPTNELYVEGLLDTVTSLYYECTSSHIRNEKNFENFMKRYAAAAEEITKSRINIKDFNEIKVLGQGAFGEVKLMRHKDTKQLYAMKLLSKFEMLKKSEVAFFWEERDIMAHANSEWIMAIHYAFQDDKYLYMAMDYMPGGDFVSLLSNYDIPEDWAAFYIAELVLAIDALHKYGYVHRDIKPDNMLLDKNGHLKLADFGTCIRMDKDGLVHSDTAVGTTDYLSPEVLLTERHGHGVYGRECDYWAVGVVLYELLVGDPPFLDQSYSGTYEKILNHKNSLQFPTDIEIKSDCKKVICGFLTTREHRLGRNGIDEIKSYKFFQREDWNWDNIRSNVAKFTPDLDSDIDTRNFDDFSDLEKKNTDTFELSKVFTGNHLPFIGYTYSKHNRLIGGNQGTSEENNSKVQSLLTKIREVENQLKNEKNAKDESEKVLKNLKNKTQKLTSDWEAEVELRKNGEIKIRDLERAAALYKHDIKEIQRKLDVETDTKKKFEAKFQELQAKLDSESSTKEDSNKLQKKLIIAERENNDLKEKLRLETEGNIKWKKIENDYRKAQAVADHAFKELFEKNKQLGIAKSDIEKELMKVQAALQAETTALKQANDQCRDIEKQNALLKDEVDQLRTKYKSDANAMQKLQDELIAVEKSKASIAFELKQLKVKYEMEKTNFTNRLPKETDVKKKLSEVQILEKEIGDIQKEREERIRIESKAANLERLINDLQLDLKNIKQKNVRLEEEYQASQNKIDSLNSLMKDENANRNDIQNKLNTVISELTAQKTKEQQLKSDLDRTLDEKKQIQEAYNKLKNASAADNIQIKELQNQLEAEQYFSNLYKTQVRELNEQVDEQRKQSHDLQNDLQMSQEDRASLSAQLELAIAKAESEDLARSIAEEQIYDLEKEKTMLELEVKDLLAKNKADSFEKFKKLQEADEKIRVLETELQNEVRKRIESIEQIKTDIVEKKQNEEIEALKKAVKQEQTLKIQAVNKLAEKMSERKEISSKGKGNKVTSAELKKKEKENKRLQLLLEQEKNKYQITFTKHQGQNSELNKELEKQKEALTKVMMELESKGMVIEQLQEDNKNLNTEIENLRALVPVGTNSSILHPANMKLEGWLSIPERRVKKNMLWKKQYVVVSQQKIFFFNNEQDKATNTPAMILDIGKLFHVRSVTQGDVIRVDVKDIPKIFQILYANEGESKNPEEKTEQDQLEQDKAAVVIPFKDHQFVVMHYHMPNACDMCQRQMWHMIKPPLAVECRRCRVKCHKDHVDEEEDVIQPCKVTVDLATAKDLLILANDVDEQKKWVQELSKKIIRKGVGALKKNSDATTNVMPRNHSKSFNGKEKNLNRSVSVTSGYTPLLSKKE
ncbi:rho-associated protein kinase 2 isoform X1 [Hydra vulgaris]|uniref:rho-associated protein kinase 2 isoform X1 n=1 Tax=Hydra vulgaris TaxID=6087 RepID=UPI0032EA3FCF